jgi:PAS domain S-box-containing protein
MPDVFGISQPNRAQLPVALMHDREDVGPVYDQTRLSGMPGDDTWWRISDDLFFVTGSDGRLLSANPAWHDRLGWTEDQLSSDVLLQIEHPLDRTNRHDVFQGALRDPHSPIRFETRLTTSDGRWLLFLCNVLKGADGSLNWVARDITAERSNQDALAEMQKLMLQERMITEVGRMAAGVMHDFNNLLQVIGGSADRLRAGTLDATASSRYIDAIAYATGRGRMLTARLLHLSRRERSSSQIFDVSEKLESLREILAVILGDGIEVNFDIGSGNFILQADPVEFEAAVINLAVNSRDAMEYRGRLSIGLRRDVERTKGSGRTTGSPMALSVSDTGPGIPVDDRNRIFEPFFTTKPVGKGTGIGLAQVLDFVRQTDGEIAVESIVGEGTTITLRLPLSNDPSPQMSLIRSV